MKIILTFLFTVTYWSSVIVMPATANECQLLEPDSHFREMMLTDPVSKKVENRVALVIGTQNYLAIPQLTTTSQDAASASDMLSKLGFKVLLLTDATSETFEQCRQPFREVLEEADIALLYYAGHGMQIPLQDEISGIVEARNYISFVDAHIDDTGKAVGFLQVDHLINLMQPDRRTVLVFLDACRDNPFLGQKITSAHGVDQDRKILGPSTAGLAEISTQSYAIELNQVDVNRQKGLLLAYAAAPNATALDESLTDTRKSPFSNALIQNISTSGLSIQELLNAVTDAVVNDTASKQIPWVSSSLTEDFHFNGEKGLDALQQESDNWASTSLSMLASGKRMDAIASALKGLPADLPPELYAETFSDALLALENAYHSKSVSLPIPMGMTASFNATATRVVSTNTGTSTFNPTHLASQTSGAATQSALSGENSIVLWDANTQKQIKALLKENDPLGPKFPCPYFSGDGTRVACLMADGSVRVWNTEAGDLVATLAPTGKETKSFAIDFEGKRIAVDAMTDMGSSVWHLIDVETGGVIDTFGKAAAPGQFGAMPMPKAGQQLDQQTILQNIQKMMSQTKISLATGLSHDGQRLVTAFAPMSIPTAGSGSSMNGMNGKFEIWDTKAKSLVAQSDVTPFMFHLATFSPSNKFLATATAVGGTRLHVWNPESGKLISEAKGQVPSVFVDRVSFNADETLYAIVGADGAPVIFDVATGNQVTDPSNSDRVSASYIFSDEGIKQGQRFAGLELFWYSSGQNANLTELAFSELPADAQTLVGQQRLRYLPITP